MNPLSIVITIAVIMFILWLIRYIATDPNTLQGMTDGTVGTQIDSSDLATKDDGVPDSNFAYSIWFYINDWNYRYGESKILLARNDKDNNPGPSVVFGAMENDITISVTCYPTSNTQANASDKHIIHECNVSNFPIQKWVNLIISLYGRTLDVYLDGKLVRTCVLPGVAKINNNADVFVTPKGGFSGMTSNIKYWSDATNPQEAYEIYKDGFGAGNPITGFFNKYKLKFSFMENNKEKGSFEL